MSLPHFGKFKEAVALIKEKNPLPSVCGRVCTSRCEVNCRRNLLDAQVGKPMQVEHEEIASFAG